ncbi:caspase-3-like [Orbicella faveolata]|uniref:caspase-3-like n=1 Tax=Orbicella faveolata TaxID=48498 RepID=UPI0009E62F98|nr:caspase-3-like [Orbicella faveolata]
MLAFLRGTAEKDFSRYDCFVSVILSHATEGGIYGTDETVIKIEVITSLFRRNECPSLEGKPEIFLIQACRGSRRDTVPVDGDSDPIPLSNSSLPTDADFLLCFASAPGHQSYRQRLVLVHSSSRLLLTCSRNMQKEDINIY